MKKRKTTRRGAGGVSAKNLRPTTFVRVEGPPATPSHTPVAMDGESNALRTGEPARIESGVHEFRLRLNGGEFGRRKHCPAGHTRDNPFTVFVDAPVGKTSFALAGLPRAPKTRLPPVDALAAETVSGAVAEETKRPGVKEGKRPAAETGAEPLARTIVYVHGIGNKPVASVLKCQWDDALFGIQLGDRSRMAYWVNREFYPVPLKSACGERDSVDVDDDEVTTQAVMSLSSNLRGKKSQEVEKAAIEREISSLAADEAERYWLQRIAGRMEGASRVDSKVVAEEQAALVATRHRLLDSIETHPKSANLPKMVKELRASERKALAYSARVLPLPDFLRRLITNKITRAFLRDVHQFFFDTDRRRIMQQSLLDRLNAGGGPFVVIAHSQGSMIAYDVLRQLTRKQCDVRLLVTIGSPLGMQEVQDIFRQWDPHGLRVPDCVGRWINVADRLDPVAIDNYLGDDFAARGKVQVEDSAGWGMNEDSPRHPHSGTGYLRTEPVQAAVREAVGNAFTQTVARAVIARDLTEQMEDSLPEAPHRVLIQLSGDSASDARDLVSTSDGVVQFVKKMIGERQDSFADPAIDIMKRFIAADLTRLEVEKLRTRFADLNIQRVWRNAEKRALINTSVDAVQARTAHAGYRASGKGIGWAVLDTGIAGSHPHFSLHKNIKAQWDCTLRRPPLRIDPDNPMFDALDGNGHGTHVAGIIAGAHKARSGKTTETFCGIAPETALYGFKVLDDRGDGHDSYIIKALDLIAELNESSSRLIIHGINLSLGGAFDPSVYGCGHTPLCEELRRLWRQGVLVCLAAGNEGYTLLQAAEGEIPANLDLSIGDPANLDEAIAVGSVHKRNPHTYGVSFFSSRGPTADGRQKPDLVAPGEQILSASHAYPREGKADLAKDLYVEMSGTSMAAPHVSGVLAGFLSARLEFVGYPDRVKRILLENCTDLGRDAYMQGRGMPNLVKMLVNT